MRVILSSIQRAIEINLGGTTNMDKSKFYEACESLSKENIVGINAAILEDDIVVKICGGEIKTFDMDQFMGIMQCYSCITQSLCMSFDIPRHQLYALTEELAQHQEQEREENGEEITITSGYEEPEGEVPAIPLSGNVIPFVPRTRPRARA